MASFVTFMATASNGLGEGPALGPAQCLWIHPTAASSNSNSGGVDRNSKAAVLGSLAACGCSHARPFAGLRPLSRPALGRQGQSLQTSPDLELLFRPTPTLNKREKMHGSHSGVDAHCSSNISFISHFWSIENSLIFKKNSNAWWLLN